VKKSHPPIAYYFRSRHPRLVSSFNYKGIPSAEAIKSYKNDGTILSKWLDVSVTKNMGDYNEFATIVLCF